MTMPVSTPIRPAYSQLTSSANAVDAITSSISVALSLGLHRNCTRFFGLPRLEQFDLKLVTAVEMRQRSPHPNKATWIVLMLGVYFNATPTDRSSGKARHNCAL
jgi:hypothetical protein